MDEEAFEFDCNYGYGVVKCDCDVEGEYFLLYSIVGFVTNF